MRNRSILRLGAGHVSILMLIYTFSGLVHPCCLGAAEHEMSMGSVVESQAGHHDMAPDDHHGAHGVDSDEESGCEGMCGLCCESAQALAVPQRPTPPEAALAAYSVAPSIGASDVLLARVSFLLPFANGPPVVLSIG